MAILRLWNYLKGYVIILVEGYIPEKFVNICIHRQIHLWDIKRKKKGIITLKISIRGFKALRDIARKSKCRIRIIKKTGGPFVLKRYKRRKAFVFGILLFISMLSLFTSFIWNIEVTGNKNIKTNDIIDSLATHGIKPGVFRFGISNENVVREIMLENKQLAWIGISIKGTNIKVTIVERSEPPVLVPKDVPCNIIARRDGLISSVITKAGQDTVKEGDTVKKGQLLISGSVETKNTDVGVMHVHAIGKVLARTWYEDSCEVVTSISEPMKTGNYKEYYSVRLLSKNIYLNQKHIPYSDYDKIVINKDLSFGENYKLPFGFKIERLYEKEAVVKDIDIEEAKDLASQKAYVLASKSIPEDAQIVKTDIKFIEDSSAEKLVANVIIECVEDIGIAQAIGGN